MLLLIFHTTNGYLFKGNLGVMWNKNGELLKIYCLSKGLYGFSFTGFSSNENFTSGYFLRSNVENYVLQNREFTGDLYSDLIPSDNKQNFVNKLIDFNSHPVPLGDRYLWSVVEFNITLLQNHFKITDKLWVYLAANDYLLPSNTLAEDMKNLKFTEALKMEMNFNKSTLFEIRHS